MFGTLGVKTVARSGSILADSLLWGQAWTSLTPGHALTIPVWVVNRSANNQPTAAQVSAIASVASAFDKTIAASLPVLASTSQQGIAFAFTTATSTAVAWTLPIETIAGSTNSTVIINRAGSAGDASSLTPGSKAYAVYLHEFAHALGLAHPHDDGGGPGTPSLVLPGVSSATSLGSYDLNQSVFTIMSYNESWRTGPAGVSPSLDYGYAMTPMALDLIVLQRLYGADMSAATGNDDYQLPSLNQVGTGYSCIWDAGGIDTITGATNLPNFIDLSEATGRVELGGGGVVSYANGIHGGVTIAAGVTIENATGGNSNDTLSGNNAANFLIGNSGDDHLIGRGGADRLTGGTGRDTFVFQSISDFGKLVMNRETITDFKTSVDLIDITAIDGNTATESIDGFQFIGNAGFTAPGQIRVISSVDRLVVYFNTDNDSAAEAALNLLGSPTVSATDFKSGLAGTSVLTEANVPNYPLAPILVGTAGNDVLQGTSAMETFTGGAGADQFVFRSLTESSRLISSADIITDFQQGFDQINLSAIDANPLSPTNDAFTFLGGAALSLAAGLRSFISGGETIIQLETDGKSGADFSLRLSGYHVLTAADFVL
jgi:serralysin